MVYLFLSSLLACLCLDYSFSSKIQEFANNSLPLKQFWLLFIFARYNGGEGLHTKVTEFVRDQDCLVCGPGILIELDTSITLQKVLPLAMMLTYPLL